MQSRSNRESAAPLVRVQIQISFALRFSLGKLVVGESCLVLRSVLGRAWLANESRPGSGALARRIAQPPWHGPSLRNRVYVRPTRRRLLRSVPQCLIVRSLFEQMISFSRPVWQHGSGFYFLWVLVGHWKDRKHGFNREETSNNRSASRQCAGAEGMRRMCETRRDEWPVSDAEDAIRNDQARV
jgi:hypothetical protein